jgi:hypothetical protein
MKTPTPIIVEVYLNTHATAWSVRAKGKVIGHAPYFISLVNATFHVQEGGRQRYLATGQKNVHAWIKGELVLDEYTKNGYAWLKTKTAIYHPKKHKSFICHETKKPVKEAAYVELRLFDGIPLVMYKN